MQALPHNPTLLYPHKKNPILPFPDSGPLPALSTQNFTTTEKDMPVTVQTNESHPHFCDILYEHTHSKTNFFYSYYTHK